MGSALSMQGRLTGRLQSPVKRCKYQKIRKTRQKRKRQVSVEDHHVKLKDDFKVKLPIHTYVCVCVCMCKWDISVLK